MRALRECKEGDIVFEGDSRHYTPGFYCLRAGRYTKRSGNTRKMTPVLCLGGTWFRATAKGYQWLSQDVGVSVVARAGTYELKQTG